MLMGQRDKVTAGGDEGVWSCSSSAGYAGRIASEVRILTGSVDYPEGRHHKIAGRRSTDAAPHYKSSFQNNQPTNSDET
jgi:hypothetical protein